MNPSPLPERPNPQDELLHLESFLPFLLSRVSNTVSQGIAETYAERHRLSVTEWRVIALLGRFPGASAVDLVERGALDKVAVSRAVNRLLERGLIQRHTAPEDRRRSLLRLSREGQAVHGDIAPAALAYESRLLEGFDERERMVLDSLLNRLWERAGLINQQSDAAA